MVCPALSECRVGDGLVIGATTLYMWGRWKDLPERVLGMVERFQLVAWPYEVKTDGEV
jgi:hypothetical protein